MVVDANIIINLVHIERLALLAAIPPYDFVLPEDVVAEIRRPDQRGCLNDALARGHVQCRVLAEPGQLLRYATLRRTLGRGEAACLTLAESHRWIVASDEKGRFYREAAASLGPSRIFTTADLLVFGIRAGVMSIEDADAAKSILETRRFRLPFTSFRDLVGDR